MGVSCSLVELVYFEDLPDYLLLFYLFDHLPIRLCGLIYLLPAKQKSFFKNMR